MNVNGELYTWGHGFFGQLGHGDNLSRDLPKKVEYNSLQYKKIKCGTHNTLAIDKKGMVYIWGRGGTNLNTEFSKHKLVPDLVIYSFNLRSKISKQVQESLLKLVQAIH